MENSHKCNDGESKAGDAMVEDTKPPSGKAVSMSSINGDETKPQKTRLPIASLSFDTFLQPTWQSTCFQSIQWENGWQFGLVDLLAFLAWEREGEPAPRLNGPRVKSGMIAHLPAARRRRDVQ